MAVRTSYSTRLHTSAAAGILIFAACLGGGASASAQTAPSGSQDPEASVEIEEVIVTGSRIRRDPATAPTPLIQVQREELLATGLSSVIDYLATIPALQNSLVPSDTTGVLNAGGLALPNLRNLGTGRTLTLVDGRRHVASPAGTLSVDIDTIPRLLIENIEIVTGGASSVYGADAVSGVLNFVLRKDFEGLEVDATYFQLNQDGEAAQRLSALAGANLLDRRLNVYVFGEYENQAEVRAADVDWLRAGWGLVGRDADTASAPYDGILDAELYRDRRTLQILQWGQVTLANSYQPSALSNPNVVPLGNCTGTSITASQCFGVAPGSTYVFEGATARPADFGDWVARTGANRTVNVGGDGENPNTIFNITSFFPESKAARFQAGANFAITPNINLYAEAKYVDETTRFGTGLSFADVYISNAVSGNDSLQILSPRTSGPTAFLARLDNAFLPANLRAAIENNRATQYGPATAGAPGAPTGTAAAPFARYTAWTVPRRQINERQLERYVIGLNGNADGLGFLRNVDWDLGYTFGRADNRNNEAGYDGERFAYALDSVIDTAGVLGAPGAPVCRVRLLTANGGTVTNRNVGNGPAQLTANDPQVRDCKPMNIFGQGNQSAESLAYVAADINVIQYNEQHNAVGSVSGQLWDLWGAGNIGVAVGAEYRREETAAQGRDADTRGRWLLLNTGPDMPRVSYETKEAFAELSVPLFRDSWLGDFAELSGSYRYSDYSTFGGTEVYGVNLVYRPIADIAFKTSFNTSIRVPSLGETNQPATQTFLAFTDPCSAINIQNLPDRDAANNRIANCAALASQLGLTFNFSDPLAANAYRPVYVSSVPGRNAGNPLLKPEESNSFTFSTVIQPRFIPNFSLVLDYYEIQIDDVIAAVSAQIAANNCVSGPTLNLPACSTLTRSPADDPNTPSDDRFMLIDFLQTSINYAKRNVRGLDFSTRYSIDTEEVFGKGWGTLTHRLDGSWLIEQKNFNNIDNPGDFTELSSTISFPRVRLTSNLTWKPTERLAITWTADFQTAQDIVTIRNFVQNADQRDVDFLSTGNFVRNDFSARYELRDDLTLRAGVTNAFDAEQARHMGGAISDNFDVYGRRFNVGLNYRY